MDKIIEEYEFDKILFNSPHRVDRYQEFVRRRIFEVRCWNIVWSRKYWI